ncbi:hypothetical protein KY363_07510, partial [Candidatus Woesearchaeota archaeon]|nr:hypothetical protein [Candidatus Woesearchaeota archaeon]
DQMLQSWQKKYYPSYTPPASLGGTAQQSGGSASGSTASQGSAAYQAAIKAGVPAGELTTGMSDSQIQSAVKDRAQATELAQKYGVQDYNTKSTTAIWTELQVKSKYFAQKYEIKQNPTQDDLKNADYQAKLKAAMDADKYGIAAPSASDWTDKTKYKAFTDIVELAKTMEKAGYSNDDIKSTVQQKTFTPTQPTSGFDNWGTITTSKDGSGWVSDGDKWICTNCLESKTVDSSLIAKGYIPPTGAKPGLSANVKLDGVDHVVVYASDGKWYCTDCSSKYTGRGAAMTSEQREAALKEANDRISYQNQLKNIGAKESEYVGKNYDSSELKNMLDRRNALHSVSGNPSEWYTACQGEACKSMSLKMDSSGNIYGEWGRDAKYGGGTDKIVLDRYKLSTDSKLKPGSDCTSDKPCDASTLYQEGNAIIDQKTGQRWNAVGVEYGGKVDGKDKTYKTMAECEAAAGKGKCGARSKGMMNEEHYYWAPTSWSDFILNGGPATSAYRSISSMIPGADDWTGAKAYLDKFFDLEKATTVDVCRATQDISEAGVALSVSGSTIPTAHIQAQRFSISPCKGLSDPMLSSCLTNRSLTSAKDHYFVYRVTGKVIPKDCDMEFQIYMHTPSGKVALYESNRVLDQGAPAFDLTGANAYVLNESESEIGFEKVCIEFKKGQTCLLIGAGNGNELCNTVYDSGTDVGGLTQIALSTEELEDAGYSSTSSSSGASTSSTTEGRTF